MSILFYVLFFWGFHSLMQESHFMRYDPEQFLAKKGLAHSLHSHKNTFMGNENFAISTCGGID
jgi:hypothetical protein